MTAKEKLQKLYEMGVIAITNHKREFLDFVWGLTKDCRVVDVYHDDVDTTHTIGSWFDPDLSPRGYWVYESWDGVHTWWYGDPNDCDEDENAPGGCPIEVDLMEVIAEIEQRSGKDVAEQVINALWTEVMDTVQFCDGTHPALQ